VRVLQRGFPGAHIAEAADGAEAVAYVMRHQPPASSDPTTGEQLPTLPGTVVIAARSASPELPGSLGSTLDSPPPVIPARVTAPLLGPVDVISMDHEMPVMNGSAATSRLRQLGVTCAIVGASGNAFDRDQSAFRASGLNELFTKPVDARAFVGYIRAHLAARSRIVPTAATGDHSGAVLLGVGANPAPSGTTPVADGGRP